MKYQSELIKEIIDSRGHEKSSLHYQSECVETWIEENKGAYPKLCDYESEWLNYIVQNPIGEFPYETVSTNTTATVNHVVPYAYKSAILKGNTLKKDAFVKWSTNYGSNIVCPIYHDGSINRSYKVYANKRYTVIRRGIWENVAYSFYNNANENTQSNIKSETFIPNVDGYIQIFVNGGEELRTEDNYKNFIVIEGEVDKNIPYFEGIQSVKMPVLTTSNEDGTKTNILTVNEDVTLRGNVYVNGGLKEDTLDLVSGEHIISVDETVLNGSENWSVWYHTDTLLRFMLSYPNMSNSPNIKLQCDKIPSYGYNQNIEGLYGNSGKLCLIIDNSSNKLSGNTVNDLKTYLSQNPFTIHYPLKEKSIKTVDLTVTDQDGNTLSTIKPIEGTMHITPTGEPIAPTAVLEVPVEAVTQNLASFIEEE